MDAPASRARGRDAGAHADKAADGGEAQGSFHVRLDNFEGPFDLLLRLIAKHQLDVTTVSLSRVTDEFVETVLASGRESSLEATSNFLVVAATLLDLKAARLLPTGEVDDPEDLALFEARDLLFARLLQYRAFKLMSAWIAERLALERLQAPRPGGLEPRFAALMPEVEIGLTPGQFADLAVRALTPRTPDAVPLEHLHQANVSVAEQAAVLGERLRATGALSFGQLVADADRLTTIGRFLALLELFRLRAITFEQPVPLGELVVRWTGETDDPLVLDEYEHVPPGPGDTADEPPGAHGGAEDAAEQEMS